MPVQTRCPQCEGFMNARYKRIHKNKKVKKAKWVHDHDCCDVCDIYVKDGKIYVREDWIE